MAGGGLAYKAITMGGTVGASTVARKLTAAVWQKTSGKQPPANPEDPDVSWGEAIGFALLSGAIIGLARMVASRQTAAYWQKKTGQLPPNLQDASS